MVVWMTGSSCVRDADGINFPMLANSSTSTFTFYSVPDCAANSSCPYGLMNYFQVKLLTLARLKTYLGHGS